MVTHPYYTCKSVLMSTLRPSDNDIPYIRLQERREWSLDQTSEHEAMEHGCSNLMGWPPMCWCDAGQMSIRQAGMEKIWEGFFTGAHGT
ncbi:hypothetical protein ACS0TY_014940 [Phlomoides rotata]